ncbi:MAG: sulfide:quinone oxidoreductase [Baekduia sp.]|jgi:sulfide:quinone oxidoreductase|nr:sulfide:quinone oxidoreductase [Baekduia sp.]
MPEPTTDPTHVVIAGGGVAAVELALALHDLAGPHLRMTLVAPEAEFELRALRTAEPFSADHVRHHALADLAAHVGAELVADRVLSVDADGHEVRLAASGTLGYDALVLATGGRHRTAYARAITFTGDLDSQDYSGLLADLDGHWTRSVAFVVPPGTTWPLPLYELALMTAQQTYAMGTDDTRLQLVSPEATPLALFGPAASAAVADLLARAGVEFVGNAYARPDVDGHLELLPGGERLDAERVVALPTIEGIHLGGVPGDDRGFIPVDEDGRVRGLADVYAAGDGTTFPVKQGGLACQQADAIAELLAAAAGADVDPQPFRPVLRGRLLTGRGAQFLERRPGAGGGERPRPELRLWSAHRKVDGRYLSPWLAELDGDTAEAVEEEHIDVAVPLAELAEAMGVDPSSPLTPR